MSAHTHDRTNFVECIKKRATKRRQQQQQHDHDREREHDTESDDDDMDSDVTESDDDEQLTIDTISHTTSSPAIQPHVQTQQAQPPPVDIPNALNHVTSHIATPHWHEQQHDEHQPYPYPQISDEPVQPTQPVLTIEAIESADAETLKSILISMLKQQQTSISLNATHISPSLSSISTSPQSTITSYELPSQSYPYQQSQSASEYSYDQNTINSQIQAQYPYPYDTTATSHDKSIFTSPSKPPLPTRRPQLVDASSVVNNNNNKPKVSSLHARRARSALAIDTSKQQAPPSLSPSKKRSAQVAALQQPSPYIPLEPQTAFPHTHDIYRDEPQSARSAKRPRQKSKRESKVMYVDDIMRIKAEWQSQGKLASAHIA